ncbi:MAG: hypothetical protein P1S60_15180 [Anaerolineae bacterium]|nr:hypothetical protein [Anaerolineae bacterium]
MDDVTIRRTCLNGWWDFIPGTDPQPTPTVPQQGWLEGQYLVPSFWTKPRHGVRKRGEHIYTQMRDPAMYDSGDYEFLFDAFGYPPGWSKSRAGWVRRTLTLDQLRAHRHYKLIVEAVMPKAHLLVNGSHIYTNIHPTLPMEIDITAELHTGDNKIVMQIDDYERDEQGRALVPTGNLIPCDHSGVWQNVWLEEHADITVSEKTSQSNGKHSQQYFYPDSICIHVSLYVCILVNCGFSVRRDRYVTVSTAFHQGCAVEDGEKIRKGQTRSCDRATRPNKCDKRRMADYAAGALLPSGQGGWQHRRKPRL